MKASQYSYMSVEVDVAKEYARKLTDHVIDWSKSYFGFSESWKNDFKVRLNRVKINQRDTRSRGGIHALKPKINICLNRNFLKTRTTFNEYKHINNDKEIGGLKDVFWYEAIACLICHEIAHAIDYTYHFSGMKKYHTEDTIEVSITKNLIGSPKEYEGHEGFWQTVYQILREKFVNHGVPDFELDILKKREKNKQKPSLGLVYIYRGVHNDELIRGHFDLIRDFKTHTSSKKTMEGSVRVRNKKNDIFLVNLNKEDLYY